MTKNWEIVISNSLIYKVEILEYGGEGGIWTLEDLRLTHFKACSFGHSDTSPVLYIAFNFKPVLHLKSARLRARYRPAGAVSAKLRLGHSDTSPYRSLQNRINPLVSKAANSTQTAFQTQRLKRASCRLSVYLGAKSPFGGLIIWNFWPDIRICILFAPYSSNTISYN